MLSNSDLMGFCLDMCRKSALSISCRKSDAWACAIFRRQELMRGAECVQHLNQTVFVLRYLQHSTISGQSRASSAKSAVWLTILIDRNRQE